MPACPQIGFYMLLAAPGVGSYVVGNVGGHPLCACPAFTFQNSDGSTPDTLLTDTDQDGAPLGGLALLPEHCVRWMAAKLRKFVMAQVH